MNNHEGSIGVGLIPFDTYNMFYRDQLEQNVLAPLRRQQELVML